MLQCIFERGSFSWEILLAGHSCGSPDALVEAREVFALNSVQPALFAFVQWTQSDGRALVVHVEETNDHVSFGGNHAMRVGVVQERDGEGASLEQVRHHAGEHVDFDPRHLYVAMRTRNVFLVRCTLMPDKVSVYNILEIFQDDSHMRSLREGIAIAEKKLVPAFISI